MKTCVLDATCMLIAKALKQIPTMPGKEMTAEVKRKVGDVGLQLGWQVWPDKEHINSGWLYDLIWQKKVNNALTDVGLVLESEWGGVAHIQYDFEKLLLAKATYKIMVFQGSTKMICAIVPKLIISIESFKAKTKGEKYLFCAKNRDNESFEFTSYVTGQGD